MESSYAAAAPSATLRCGFYRKACDPIGASGRITQDKAGRWSAGTTGSSMRVLVAYFSVLIVFGIIDAGWLSIMANILYRPVLGDILLSNLRFGPAIVFYLAYPVGVVAFAVVPGLREDSIVTAFLLALLFGALAYGTYDLTNYATLRNWNLQITVMDIVYGALASSIAATVAYFVVRAIVR